ncbi:allene oxide cyclase barrel-like domain-containing protein [Mycolicibacterium llatzerense]|uniref:allene oxide cyclase barrel-like domain-containing protein n=1 Tax=Mycolicibacterium llatzerense TaxID=280871 RepID=UPI0008DC8305|nr:hypothetical protein [Mycolicibacterium llatzerense]
MNMLRTTTAVLIPALLLTMSCSSGSKKADDSTAAVTTLHFYEHDTGQTSVDLGTPGEGPGDQFIFSGDVFDRQGGTKLGRTAGQCTTVSGDATSGDVSCTETFILDGGQISIQMLADRAAVFSKGETLPVSIVGGSGKYNKARGDGTAQVPPEVPNQTDANFVLNVVTN